MGLTNETTNLLYARNELIKVGESFVFDKVADMIYYCMANDDISTASTVAQTIAVTDEDGGGYGLKISNTFTKVGAIAHKALWSDLTYTPASTGTACPIAVAGKVNLNGNLTRANDYPGYGWGVQGQIHIVTGTTIAGTSDYDPGPVYAGLRGVTTDAGTSTYTDGTITSLYAETQISQNAATGSFRVFLAWLRCQGSGTSTDIDAALYIDSGNAWGNNITIGVDVNDCVTGIDVGTCTTGINLSGTQTNGIVIGSGVTTGISVDSTTDSTGTTDGSIHTDGGVGIAKKLYVGDDIVATTSTGADVNVNGIFETLTVSGNCTGSVCGLRVRAVTDGTARTIGNFYGANVDARLVHANDALSGIMAGLQVAVSLGECATGSLWVYGINIDLSEAGGARATAIKAFIDFQDYDYDGSFPCANLFDVGGSGSRASTGGGKLFNTTTLKILVNTADKYIPLSTAENAYTTAATITTTGGLVGGVDTTGVDVTFHGGTVSGQKFFWDASQSRLAITHSELVNDGGGSYNAAFKVTAINNLALTSNRLCGISANVEPKASVDVLTAIGLESCVYAVSTADCSVQAMAIYAEIQGFNSITDVYGIKVFVDNNCVPSGSSACIRMDDDSDNTKETDAFLMMSNSAGLGPLYIMQFQTLTGHAFNGATAGSTCADVGGYLKVHLLGGGGGSGDRYIQLWRTKS